LDTTFLVDAERHAHDLDAVIADDDDVAIAAVTAAELLVGALSATERYRSARQAFVDGVLDTFPVLSYDTGVAEAHTALLAATRRTGRPRGAHDLVIAATARATGRSVRTADPTGFADLPQVELAD
jgi:tRNA(fMet)-specific endonuclease VapC